MLVFILLEDKKEEEGEGEDNQEKKKEIDEDEEELKINARKMYNKNIRLFCLKLSHMIDMVERTE